MQNIKIRNLAFAMFSLAFFMLSTTFSSAASTNISILHAWNGSDFVPLEVDADGNLKTTLNLTESTGMFPDTDNLRDLGTSALRWRTLYVVDMVATGNLDIGWTNLSNYPGACDSGKYVTAVGDILTCSTPTPSSGGGWTNTGTVVSLTTITDLVGIGTASPAQPLTVQV